MAIGGTNFKLRSDVERATYNALDYPAVGVKVAGAMEQVGDVVGVWVYTSAAAEDNVLCYEASKIVVPCMTITAGNAALYALGQTVYYDSTNACVNAVASGGPPCGIILVAPSTGDTTIEIHLMGALGIYT